MAINISSSSTYTSSNSTIRISNSTITANNCEIYGDNNVITGNNNDIKGNNNRINGNNNDIKGDNNQITGNNNDVKGHNCTLMGNNNDYKAKKSSNKKSVDVTPPKSDGGNYRMVGNYGTVYSADTPREVISKYRAGEKAAFEIEQQRLSAIQKSETERIRQEFKISQRRWKIDNVNLTDEEYKIVEDYMNDIKPLWETW
jgi:hypothetical protein